MKSKSSTYIIIVVVLIVIAILVYFFAVKGSSSSSNTSKPGLVSTTAGSIPTSSNTGANGIPTSATNVVTPGGQVVVLLRNLSVIRLDDTVFTNPSFGLLEDLSVQLPQVTSQGRRNPFASVGSSAPMTATPASSTVTFQIPAGN